MLKLLIGGGGGNKKTLLVTAAPNQRFMFGTGGERFGLVDLPCSESADDPGTSYGSMANRYYVLKFGFKYTAIR